MLRRIAFTAAVAAPLALFTSVASAGWIQTSDSLGYTFAKSSSASTTFAGRKFSIGYSTSLDTKAMNNKQVHAATGYVGGNLSVPVTFFDTSASLFAGKASGLMVTSTFPGAKPSLSGKYEVSVVGKIVKSGSISVGKSGTLASYSSTLLKVETQVVVYGVPIHFTADATGGVSLDGSFAWSGGKLTFGLTPKANVDGHGSAAAGGKYLGITVEAGVTGDLAVLDASVPLKAWLTPLVSAVNVGASGNLALSGMSGKVGLYAKACAFGKCPLNWSQDIFSWNGVSYNFSLFNVSKTVNL